MPRNRSILQGVSFTLLASVISVGVSLIFNVLLGRQLGPEIKGRVDLMMATIGFSFAFFSFSINSGVTYIVAQGNANLRRLGIQLTALTFLQGGIAFASFQLLQAIGLQTAFIPSEYSSWGKEIIVFAVTLMILAGYAKAIILGLQRFELGALLDISEKLFLLVFAILIVWYTRNHRDLSAAAIVSSQVLLNFIVLAEGIALVWPYMKSTGHFSRIKDVLGYSVPSFGANLAQFANYRLDIFLVAFYTNTREVALYAVAVNIAQLLWLPPSALQAVLFPRLSGTTDFHLRIRETTQVMRVTLAFSILGAIVAGIVAPFVINLFFGRQYSSSASPFYLLLPGIVIFVISKVLCGYLAAIGKPQLNFWISFAGLFGTVSLDLFLVPYWGMNGAALASTISYSVSSVCALYFFIVESKATVFETLVLTRADIIFMLQTLTRLRGNPRIRSGS
jgi:O-antigen/teichoic acid export membrane protein